MRAWHGVRLAGFAVIGPCTIPDRDPQITAELLSLYVDPDHFRQRIGTMLHDACIKTWQARTIVAARLWVMEYNQRARAFYVGHGWKFDGLHRSDNPAVLGYRLKV